MIIQPPRRYASIHGHSHFSPYDGFGQPSDHIDFSISNGLDSWTLTDHGNGNGLAHAHTHAKKLITKGKHFRQLFGVEFYFVPDLNEWRKAYVLSKSGMSQEEESLVDEDGNGRLVVEDADETRSSDAVDNINRRYHVVVVARDSEGLANLFTLVKRSFREGFYKFPRIDFQMLREHGRGLIVSTACVGGFASGNIFREFPDKKFSELTPEQLVVIVSWDVLGIWWIASLMLLVAIISF